MISATRGLLGALLLVLALGSWRGAAESNRTELPPVSRCQEGDYSERCAAWAAAESADYAAKLAAIQAVLSILTALGLIASLYFTRRSLAHAEQTATSQLKPYLYPCQMGVTKLEGNRDYRLQFAIKNYGETPARSLRVASIGGIIDPNDEFPDVGMEHATSGHTLSPGEDFRFTIELSASQIEYLKNENKLLFLRIKFTFVDYLNNTSPLITFACIARGEDVPGERIFTIVTEAEEPASKK